MWIPNRFNSPEIIKQPSSFSWKMLPCLWDWFVFVEDRTFSCDATCKLWNLAPLVRMCTWNFPTYTCTELGNWACREFCREQVGWVTCASLSTGGGNLTCIRKKSGILSIPSHSAIWQQCGVTPQQNTQPTLPPPLCKHVCLCTSHCKFGLRAEDLYSQNLFHSKSRKELLGT